jgi:hypothetical protein
MRDRLRGRRVTVVALALLAAAAGGRVARAAGADELRVCADPNNLPF